MRVIDFLEAIFAPKSQRTASAQAIIEELEKEIWYREFALHIVSEVISGVMSNVEWETFVKHEKKQGDNWYMFNYEPNPNQSGAEFKKELAKKLVCNREALIIQVGKRLYVADDFTKNYPDTVLGEVTFTDVVVSFADEGDITLNGTFNRDNSIYLKYQNPTVEAWFEQLTSLYAQLIDNVMVAGSSKVKYQLNIDTTAAKGLNIDYQETTKKLINEDFKALASDNNVILPLYNGFDLKQLNNGNNLAQNASIANKSVNEVIKTYLTDCALAYCVPEDILFGKGSENDHLTFMTYCIDPLYNIIENGINRCFYGRQIFKGFKIEINTRNTWHFEILRAGSAFSQLISSGVESINDIRGMLGQTLIDSEIGDVHWITRNYSEIGSFIQEAEEFNSKVANGEQVSTTGGGLK